MQALLPMLALVVMAAVLVRRGRRRRRPVAALDLGRPPEFDIVALGAQETGKTVLLATMYHRLSTEKVRDGLRLTTDLGQAVHLGELWGTLADTDRSWPPGTNLGETRAFTFDCIGWADGVEHRAFRFNYLDYAGELLGGGGGSGEHDGPRRDLERRIDTAHAVFGIIDGRRMADHLRGVPGSSRYLDSDLVPLVGALRRARCPVHLLITKWDLFDDLPGDENERLEAVSRALLDQPHVRNLVDQRRRERRIVRLLPVSAIGREFADADGNGHMVKRPDGRLRPVHVEVPLSAVIPDLFEQIRAALSGSTKDLIAAQARDLSRLTVGEAVAALAKLATGPLGGALRQAAALAVGANAFSDHLADTFLAWMSRPFDDRMGDVERAVSEAQRQAAVRHRVQERVLTEFAETMVVLRHHLPASDLTAGRVW